MNPVKNIHFTLLIRINKQLHEFNFRRRNEDLYDSDTSDGRGKRYYFKVIKQDHRWQIEKNDLPTWILENEGLICGELVKKEKA